MSELFINKNVNPKDNKASDCVVRAIVTATNEKWEDVYMDLCRLGLEMKDMPNSKPVWKKYLDNRSFTKYSIKVTKGSKRPTVESFTKDHKKGTYILSVANHLTVCKDGNYIDSWDCGNKSLYGYWGVK